MASTDKGDWIFDPFSGSSTTGIAANLCGRRFAGIEQNLDFCKMSKARREEIDNKEHRINLQRHIVDLKQIYKGTNLICFTEQENIEYGKLPFKVLK